MPIVPVAARGFLIFDVNKNFVDTLMHRHDVAAVRSSRETPTYHPRIRRLVLLPLPASDLALPSHLMAHAHRLHTP